ncbi:MAG: hypothetical protein Fur0041_22110 [Bacteroidia bacterium]
MKAMLSNSVELVGLIGMNPEIKSTTTGKKVARFTLAHKPYKNNGNNQVNWFQLVAWEEQAAVAEQYLYKGRKVGIKGKLVTRLWTDKNGVKRSSTEIVVSDMIMMDNMNYRAEQAA